MRIILYSLGLTYLRLWSYRTNMSILEEMRLEILLASIQRSEREMCRLGGRVEDQEDE
jgi:hypothetical protein